ncbi:uncharacterized protein L201_000625 [Kwoniella dendrophila CBS 6074]|uniref:Nitroreductase domain-containing protein n=1 Tax=Kwoniella dendrophila CBS 6074 TaxID=1295534 RepID=A0AAX4JLI8_9TREE
MTVTQEKQDRKITTKSAAFFEAVKTRRSNYNITNESPLTNEQLQEIIEQAVLHTPTAFNSQTSRAILIVDKEKNDQIWEIVKKRFIESLIDKNMQAFWSNHIDNSFKAGYGTVIFFEDQNIIKQFASEKLQYAQEIPIWSGESSAMLQYIVWSALTVEGYGASLQHFAGYTPHVKADINDFLEIPKHWKNTAMMPFGLKNGPPGHPGATKQFGPIEDRTRFIFKDNDTVV